MASFNKVMLMGNLTRDPVLRYLDNGDALVNFGLAVNRKFKKGDVWEDDVCFVEITVWRKQAENCDKYLSKGRPVFIEGYLKFSTWESDGQKRNKLEVVANTVQFLGSSKDTQGGPPTFGDPPDPPGSPPTGPVPAPEDDLPF